MPIVLMQRAWREDPGYKDTEFVVYHYPRKYFDRISGGERFVYYRPSRGAKSDQASTYFGCGELGDVFPDGNDPGHRFVEVRKPIRFASLVPFEDRTNRMYESRYKSRNAFQGQSIRYIDDLDFHRILDAAGLTGAALADAPTVDDVISGRVSPLLDPPTDAFRPMLVVPQGTGYKPNGSAGPDVYESAALQERARDDHQKMVRLIKKRVDASGGTCLFNNNVDILARFAEQKYLIEVKSLNNPSAAVDRMRYGMGQLFDYSVRYRAKIGKATPVLAFGAVPKRDVSWIADILQGNDVAFITQEAGELRPMNELARKVPVFL
jgi:hypothetical protein